MAEGKKNLTKAPAKEPVLSTLISEIQAVSSLAGAVLLLLSFVSYHPKDPVFFNFWLRESLKREPENLLGHLGATFSSLFIDFFGVAALLLLLPLIDFGLARLFVRRVKRSGAKAIGLSLLVTGVCGFFQLVLPEMDVMDMKVPTAFHPGGIWGRGTVYLFSNSIGVFGAYLVSLVLILCGFLLVTKLSLSSILEGFVQLIKSWLERVRTKYNRRSTEKDRETRRAAVVKKHEQRRKEEEKSIVPAKKPKLKPKKKAPQVALPLEPAPGTGSGYTLPPLSLLDRIEDDTPINETLLMEKANELKSKLLEFNVDGVVEDIVPGPVVTTIEFKMAPGIKFSKVQGLADDLALALSAETIRIDRVLGRPTIGVEIPNEHREMIGLMDLIECEEFQNSSSKLTLVFGRNIHGGAVVNDLGTMPHLLIAGTTGSGKSVGLNTLITSILYKASPDEVKFILVDPKMVEMEPYKELPHLLTPVVTDPRKAANALRWAVKEMEGRLKTLAGCGVRNLDHYNRYIVKENERRAAEPPGEDGEQQEMLKPLPYIVIIIDELSDLMMVAKGEVESSIARLAQMARAVGLHLVLATQRPSVDVVTGLIKSNMPSRVSFRLLTGIDSRTILDQSGADKLLGKGDMLFLAPGTSRLQRVHGPYISVGETRRIVQYCARQAEAQFNLEVLKDTPPKEGKGLAAGGGELDALYDDALRLIVNTGQASTSYLQRKLGIGYARAGKIMDQLEDQGVVGPGQGSKPREILIDPEQLEG